MSALIPTARKNIVWRASCCIYCTKQVHPYLSVEAPVGLAALVDWEAVAEVAG